MIKKIKDKIKHYLNRFIEKIFGKQYTDKEGYEKIFNWVLNNKPHIMSETCLCGNVLTIYDVEKHFARDYVHILYYCKKCNCTTERRYSYLLELLKD